MTVLFETVKCEVGSDRAKVKREQGNFFLSIFICVLFALSFLLLERGGVVENTILSVLAFAALGLLVAVSGGIIYLTAVEWGDRRREQREKRGR